MRRLVDPQMRVQQLFIHPVKGLTPQQSDRVDLQTEHGILGDRAFALMFSSLDADHASFVVPWMKKQNFAVQADWAGLAALDCHYNLQTAVLTVKHKGVELLVANTNIPEQRYAIGAFFTGYLAAIHPSQSARHPQRAPLRLVGDSNDSCYLDRKLGHLSLVSQATLDHIGEAVGQWIDVRRFRPNIVLAGVPAWAEFDLVGQEIQLGSARLEITEPITRCLNIDVNPDTGERDIPLFSLLKQHFNHQQTGVVAKVISNGSVAVGDDLIVKPLP